MPNEISRAEAWTRVHEVFTQVNFNSFDFNTIKESLLDYMRLYFSEDYNDYIESSEFIAILELFAYVGELLSYRLDLNAHENFISTAERKESILRLAKLISYNASRNIAARGLVRINSIRTTEQVIDAQGRNISNTNINWNDLNNPDWKEQFLVVMNRALQQPFGTVAPNERVQVDDVLFELYTWNNQPLTGNGITTFNYTVSSAGTTFPLELVPVELTATSPVEKRPERNANFSILYGADGLGDGSDSTGFFLFTKQGTLQVREQSFDGITPNLTNDVLVNNINQTDVWLNNVDADTRAIIEADPFVNILPHLNDSSGRFGEWEEVTSTAAQNVIFNTSNNRQQFEIETLDNDQIRVIFGDGEFSDIPTGAFDLWYRTSANTNSIIQSSSAVDLTASFTYLDITNTTQTFTFTFSLVNSLQNSSASEDIEHIRRVAPSVYYTQDRMVNGRDYNTFMLQDPSILKLQAINRTFSGDSKYIAWHDPQEYYEDVKIFGEDLALYWLENDVGTGDGGLITANTPLTSSVVITNLIEPILCSTDFFNIMLELFNDVGATFIEHCTFTVLERPVILAALDLAAISSNPRVDLYFAAITNTWTVGPNLGLPLTQSRFLIRIESQFIASAHSGWSVQWSTRRMSAQSQTTRFRNTNTTTRIVNFDTLSSNDDNIIILRANTNGLMTSVLPANLTYNVLAQELVEQNLPNAGLPDRNRLSVIPTDVTNDGIPDNLEQTNLLTASLVDSPIPAGINPTITFTLPVPPAVTLEMYFMLGTENESVNVMVTDGATTTIYEYNPLVGVPNTWRNTSPPPGVNILNDIILEGTFNGTETVTISTRQFVYFNRGSITEPFVPVPDNDTNREAWFANNSTTLLYKREFGRFPLNFAWFYTTPRLNLVDPAASNIIDIFIITTGFYDNVLRFLANETNIRPIGPTSLDLRTAYDSLLQSAMISDTVILHPGDFKIIFGSRAVPELQASFSVIRPLNTTLTDNEVKVRIVNVIRQFFSIQDWEFGDTFYFTELSTVIHQNLGPEINSIVLVATFNSNQFGDLFQIPSREDEILIADINTSDIVVVNQYTPENIRQ